MCHSSACEKCHITESDKYFNADSDIFSCFRSSTMSALPAKPGLHHSVSEWYSNNYQLSATAQHERLVSNVIRQEGRSLCNETNCKVGFCFVRMPSKKLQ